MPALVHPRYSLIPIADRRTEFDPCRVVQIVIRCSAHGPTAVAVERWLEERVVQFRAQASIRIVRLSRVKEALPTADPGVGWLIELELHEGGAPLAEECLVDALTDMRLLGLTPTVLVRLSQSEWHDHDSDAAMLRPSFNGRPS